MLLKSCCCGFYAVMGTVFATRQRAGPYFWMGAILHPKHSLASSKVSQWGYSRGCNVFRSYWMPTIVQVGFDGRTLAWLGGYVWDRGRLDDDVIHGGAGTCTPQHWSERQITHVRRFALATRTIIHTLAAFDMRHNTPRMGFEVTRAFLECFVACHEHKSRFTRKEHSDNSCLINSAGKVRLSAVCLRGSSFTAK